MLVAVIILALYFWAFFADVTSINAALLVGDLPAIAAGGAFAAAFISYLWAPKNRIVLSSFITYGVLVATTAILILSTGGALSPFIALWMIVAVFSGVFGLYAVLLLAVLVVAYLLLAFFAGAIGREQIIVVVLAGELPLVISYVIWHKAKGKQTKEEQAYRELATELSQVTGKAEVVINAIADGVIALNREGNIELINPAAQQIIGWGRQDALNLNYKSVLKLLDKKNEALQPAADPIEQALANNKEVETSELSIETNSGKKLQVSVIVSPVGKPGDGVIVVFRDITRQKAEEREQAEFISTASHEMRTPVASIEGYLGLALNPSTAQVDAKAREFITKAQESSQHLGRLFQDLLDVTKAEDGRLSNNPKVTDVVSFVHDIVQGFRPKAEEKQLRLVFKPEPDTEEEQKGERRMNPVFYANVDNDHLREVVSNLIDNAIKYTPEGDVSIDITGDDEKITLSVADTGIGIPTEDMPHLFQKFYRVDNSATREIGGTGLGLYLCRRLTEAMGGRIWAESTFKEGSTFYVELARTPHEEAIRLIEGQKEQEESKTQAASQPEIPAAVQTELEQAAASPAPETQQPSVGQPLPVEPQPIQSGQQPEQPVQTQVPTQPQPIQQQPAIYQNAPMRQAGPQIAPQPRPNIPLASLEQNPAQYTRGGVSVPPRQKQP